MNSKNYATFILPGQPVLNK